MSQLKASPVLAPISAAVVAQFELLSIPEPTSGCWLWEGNSSVKSYGQFYIGRRGFLAHRVSYTIYKGPIPAGMHVRHQCDNPICVNPDHLLLGTHQNNMDDRARRGRSRGGGQRGEACAWAKLDDAAVRRIRADARPGSIAAADYGITPGTYYKIKNRQRWGHIQ